jgi:hypothetical protein
MVTKYIFASLFAILTFSAAHAQRGGFNIADHLLIREAKSFGDGRPKVVYEGSPYLNDEFKTGVVSAGTMQFNGVPMRYNIVDDVMEYQVVGQTFLLDPDPKITKIVIGDQTFVVVSNGFYELQVEGKLSLLSKKVINYRPNNDLTGVPAKYSRQEDIHYLILADLSQEKVTTMKNFLDFIPDKKEEMTALAKTEKLSVKDWDDLVRLVKYYNSLSTAN